MTARWSRRLHVAPKLAIALAGLVAATLLPARLLPQVAAALLLLLVASKASLAWRGLLVGAVLAPVTAAILAFTLPAGDPVVRLGLTLYPEGARQGLVGGARIALAVGASLWAAETTPPRQALTVLRPWPRAALAGAVAAGLAPALARDLRAVQEAHRLRGLQATTRLGRVAASAALLPPLVVRAARRGLVAEEALRAAGYGEGVRVAYGHRRLHALDWAIVGAAAVAVLGVVALLVRG